METSSTEKEHGTANGKEQSWFHRFTRPKIFTTDGGTSSSDTSSLNKCDLESMDPSFTDYLKVTGRKRATIQDIIAYQEEYEKYDSEMLFDPARVNAYTNSEQSKPTGFGWIKGVLMRCVLCIFGATLFLRMSWMGGQAGILLSLAVIVLSFIVVGITAISMSAIATNGEIRNGGLYYLISRSLGPEFGGSIGFVLWLANTINASMNCVGLAETIVEILKDKHIKLLDGGINDIRIYGLGKFYQHNYFSNNSICLTFLILATCIILQAIIFIGTEFENKTQVLLMITVIISVGAHIVGSFLPIREVQELKGLMGYEWSIFYENLWPDFRGHVTFIAVFGVYFPAMTGMMAGANMSGDLRDPSSAIPKGTIWGILITTITYALSMLITSACTIRDADGVNMPIFNYSSNSYEKPECYYQGNCKFGLANDFNVATLQGAWSPLIIAGIVATTLSSASGCLIGGPRVLQALCEDKLFPFIEFFAKGHGKSNDPFRAYFLTAILACGIILIGDLNAIAELITNFFLATFAITNFACFDATTALNPGFRPGFRFYNKWLSLFGALLCVGLMFFLSWITSLITMTTLLIMFIYIKYNKSHINWGSSTEANRYRAALDKLLKITRTAEHVKNYRPQLLVLSGNPASRQVLVDFAACITKGQSLLMCGHIVPQESNIYATACIRKLNARFTDWLNEKRIRAFYCAVANTSIRAGVQQLLQSVGLGKMHPNIMMIGYKANWVDEVLKNSKKFNDYLGVISDAFESNMSVCIFRNEELGLDHSALLSNDEQLILKLPVTVTKNGLHVPELKRGLSSSTLNEDGHPRMPVRNRPEATFNQLRNARGSNEGPKKLSILGAGDYDNYKAFDNGRFRRRIQDGVVDVWWLFDDGGLELLLAHLLTKHHSYLQGAILRVFSIAPQKQDPENIKNYLIQMMKKFRIEFSDVYVLHDGNMELYEQTLAEHDDLVETLNENQEDPKMPIDLLNKYAQRTCKIMKQRELMIQYSKASSLVIATLPVAPQNVLMSPLYYLWLELLSKNMPPVLFVRGNQSPTITYFA
ncbi:Solute carrier family 12 member 1 [Aphelenchoides bicaudatus]|nr:Solute carrier family 12 member 1 [Aphelenchoides bicaudatus]